MHKAPNNQLPETMASMFMRTENYHKHKLSNQNTYFTQRLSKNIHQEIHNNLFRTYIMQCTNSKFTTYIH